MRLPLAALSIALSCIVIGFGCQDLPGKGDPSTPLPGIDISHFQGEIDFQKVARSGVRFVFFKATEGHTYTDPKFTSYWKDAGKTDLIRGAYHFLHPDVDGATQAKHFLSVAALKAGDLPPVVDVERMSQSGNANLTRTLEEYLTEIRKRTGHDAIIYVSPAFWEEHIEKNIGAQLSNPLWIAQYNVNTPRQLKKLPSWTFWQHTNTGSVPGIKGHVDLDYGRNFQAIRIPH